MYLPRYDHRSNHSEKARRVFFGDCFRRTARKCLHLPFHRPLSGRCRLVDKEIPFRKQPRAILSRQLVNSGRRIALLTSEVAARPVAPPRTRRVTRGAIQMERKIKLGRPDDVVTGPINSRGEPDSPSCQRLCQCARSAHEKIHR